MRFLVIIPITGQRIKQLNCCLNSLDRQTFKDFDIIIESGNLDNWNEAMVRNHAVRRSSKGEFLIQLNADLMLAPGLLEWANNMIVEHGNNVIIQSHRWDIDEKYTEDIFTKKLLLNYSQEERQQISFKELVTGGDFQVISRESYERIGGFDEIYKGWGFLEHDLHFRYHCLLGYKAIWNNVLTMYHLYHPKQDTQRWGAINSRIWLHKCKKLFILERNPDGESIVPVQGCNCFKSDLYNYELKEVECES